MLTCCRLLIITALTDLHGSHSFLPEFPVVFHWNIPSLLELKAGVDGQLLPGGLPEGFGPLGLAGVLLLLKVLVTLGSERKQSEEANRYVVMNYLQKLKILQSFLTNLTPLPGYTLEPQK